MTPFDIKFCEGRTNGFEVEDDQLKNKGKGSSKRSRIA